MDQHAPTATARRRAGGAAVTLAALVFLAGAVTTPFYTGHPAQYLTFHGICAALACAAVLPPRSYGFSALTIFLLLGFWLKVTATTIGIDPLIEATGDFSGSPQEWDEVLSFCTAGLVAVAAPKLLLVFLRAGKGRQPTRSVPSFFLAWRRSIWCATVIAIVLANAANWTWRLYMVGVHELLVLPLHLNAVIAWWLTTASTMWIALLLEWEFRCRRGVRFGPWLLMPLAEALITSTVMLSRGFYLMKVLPYVLVLGARRIRRELALPALVLSVLSAAAIAGFAASLALVSSLRLEIHPKLVLDDRAGIQVIRGQGRRALEMNAVAQQLTEMIVGRWIGLEGVLAVCSSPQRGRDLWLTALFEDPAAGNAALYQRIAKSPYRPQKGVTFQTLPGLVAVMSYAGSLWVTLLGVMALTVVLLGAEAAARGLIGSEFLCAVIGVALANTLVQMNFPYLTGAFLIELWVTIFTFWGITALLPQVVVRDGQILRTDHSSR
jgi:hypothetical protein